MDASARPTAFGSYLLDRKLAVGGMAEVFLARQQGFGGFEKQVVIKRILPSLSTHSEFVQMFLNEARLAAKLSHSNVVQIFEAGEIDGQYYIAMEYIEGTDLKIFYNEAARTKRPTPPGIACRIVADLLAGLHYAHTRIDDKGRPLGIVHRDVSPQNVLVTRTGVVKVVDFGIAKATRAAAQQTQAGQVKGKIAYLSPEQAMGKPLDARSDVFACGILLWELCTGVRLFAKPNDMATILAITEQPIPSVRSVRAGLPESLDRVLSQALARELPSRYASAQVMQTELEALIRAQGWLGDQKSLERYVQERLSATMSLRVPTLEAPLERAYADDPTDRESDVAASIAVPTAAPAPAEHDSSNAATIAMAAQPAYEPPPPMPRPRTPSGMRAMPPNQPSPSHPPPYEPHANATTLRPPSAGRRIAVVMTAAVLVSVGAIVALDWKPVTPTATPLATAAQLHVELSEPALLELDGHRTRVEQQGELELPANRQATVIATTLRAQGLQATRTISLPPAKPGERIPLKINFATP